MLSVVNLLTSTLLKQVKAVIRTTIKQRTQWTRYLIIRNMTQVEQVSGIVKRLEWIGGSDITWFRLMERLGKDGTNLRHSMLKYLSIRSQEKLLLLCNKVWEKGRMPWSWKGGDNYSNKVTWKR